MAIACHEESQIDITATLIDIEGLSAAALDDDRAIAAICFCRLPGVRPNIFIKRRLSSSVGHR